MTNPQLEIADIEMLSKIAKKHELLLIADSKLTPPNVFEAGKFRVNVEVVSATKYISGGATAFGGAIIDYANKTLIIHPHSTIYAEFPEEERQKAGIRDTMMRLSVGIENVEDLIEDIVQALEWNVARK